METALLHFILMGFLGGIAYCLVWKEYKPDEVIRRLALGAIAGFLYFNLSQTWNLPDGVMAFVSGYFSVDFIEGVTERLEPILNIKRRKTSERGGERG